MAYCLLTSTILNTFDKMRQSIRYTLLFFALIKLQINYAQTGKLALNFGNNGVIITDLQQSTDYASAITMDKSGNVLVAGTTEKGYDTGKQVFAAQYNNRGQLQTNFGKNGKILIPVAHQIRVAKIMMQYDGKILIGGTANEKDKSAEFFILRLLADGTPDKTFGINGLAKSKFAVAYATTKSNYILNDFDLDFYNNIIAVGANNSSMLDQTAIIKFTPSGIIDENFLFEGMYVGSFPITNSNNKNVINNSCTATKVVALSNGTYLVGGTQYMSNANSAYENFTVQRILSNGAADTTFNYGKAFSAGFDEASDELSDIMVNANGNYILVGTTDAGDQDFGCMALNKMGFLDYSAFGDVSKKYGITGKTQTGFAKKTNQEAVSSVMLPDGKFVVVGKGGNIEEEIVIARYLPNGQLDNTFGEEGKTTFTPAGLTNDDLFDIYKAVLDYEGNLLIVGWLSSKNSATSADIFIVAFTL